MDEQFIIQLVPRHLFLRFLLKFSLLSLIKYFTLNKLKLLKILPYYTAAFMPTTTQRWKLVLGLRIFFQNGSQHDPDGHRGKTLIEAYMTSHMIGRATLVDRLEPGTLATAIHDGKEVRNSARRELDRKRRLEKSEMQDANGLNIIPDRAYRKAYWDDQGKQHFENIILQVGDPIPTAKRPSKITEGLDKTLLKKLKKSV